MKERARKFACFGVGAVALAAAIAGCASGAQTSDAPTSSASASATPGARSPVVVAIVIDQLPMWMAVERWKTLPRSGGFSKLVGEAINVAELHHGHAFNATAPGHAALFTGGPAHASGITSNGKLSEGGDYLSVLADPSTNVVTATGVESRQSSSIAGLELATVADSLKHAKPNAMVISLSMKDRGALFGAGRKPDAALWYDATNESLVTSTAFTKEVPAWARAFATRGATAKYREQTWVPSDPKWLAMHADLPAPDIGQGDYFGLGNKFPHDLTKATKPAKAFVATPFADTFLVDVAIAAIDEIAKRDAPALLAISFSATDYIGHVFGPDAPEAWDQMLRLDGELFRLLGHLDEKLGPEGYGVVLSSDHGVVPTPEVMNQGFCGRPDKDRFERRCDRALRLSNEELAKVAEQAADGAAGAGDWILGMTEPFIVFRPATRALPKDKLDAVAAAVVKALAATPGIARAIDVRTSPKNCPPPSDESIDALVCRSIRGSTGGDVYLMTKPGTFIDTTYVTGDGVNHGTPYLFDRAVPLIVRMQFPQSRGGILQPELDTPLVVDQRAYAASIAGMFTIEPPEAAIGGTSLAKGPR